MSQTVEQRIAELASEYFGKQVDRVETYGTDWERSTMDGFREAFYMRFIGPGVYKEPNGTEAQKFWNFVLQKAAS